MGTPFQACRLAARHLPLMVDGAVPWSDIAYVTVQSVVYTWLFNNTDGSVLLVVVFHTMNNVISGGFFHAMFSGADWVRMGWLLVALWCAVALIVAIVNGAERLSRKHNKQTPTQHEDATLAPRVALAGATPRRDGAFVR